MLVKMKEVLLLSSYSSVSQVRSRIPCTGFDKMRASQGPAAAGWASRSDAGRSPSTWESDGAVGVEQFLDCPESVTVEGCLSELANVLQFSLIFYREGKALHAESEYRHLALPPADPPQCIQALWEAHKALTLKARNVTNQRKKESKSGAFKSRWH